MDLNEHQLQTDQASRKDTDLIIKILFQDILPPSIDQSSFCSRHYQILKVKRLSKNQKPRSQRSRYPYLVSQNLDIVVWFEHDLFEFRIELVHRERVRLVALL